METQYKHNFGAGPCILPPTVLQQAAQAVINWNGSGLSVLEISHRSPEFERVVDKTRQLVKELLKVPDSYSILFLQGGASTQFSMVPQSFLSKKALYHDTGVFATKAIKEASLFGEVVVLASSADKGYSYIPDLDVSCEQQGKIKADYLHTTSNNTIEGTQHFNFPQLGIPHICDMSSDIFSRQINVRDFDLIYAGAQKNIGPAGMTLVIVNNDLLDRIDKPLPAMADYRVLRDHGSMYNTPPVFSIYVAMLNLIWLMEQGGVKEMERRNIEKSELLYREIDRNTLFQGTASVAHRSRMNITFRGISEPIEREFLQFAGERGMVGLKGYRTVGGFRASLYNALPLSSVQALVSCMQDFELLWDAKSTHELASCPHIHTKSAQAMAL